MRKIKVQNKECTSDKITQQTHVLSANRVFDREYGNDGILMCEIKIIDEELYKYFFLDKFWISFGCFLKNFSVLFGTFALPRT